MLNIAITGGLGLLGWHTRCHLYSNGTVANISDRSTFSTEQNLDTFVRDADVVLHFAGMNRGSDQEVYDTNILLTERLLTALDRKPTKTAIIFSSSTHNKLDTRYGESKRKCEELIKKWAENSENRHATILVLPNVYGESGRPFYNSVVSTFCHLLANNDTPNIDIDNEITLIHARRVASKIENILASDTKESNVTTLTVDGDQISVSNLLALLSDFDSKYHLSDGIIPMLDSRLKLDLFNTYRSYLFPSFYPTQIQSHSDNRGSLLEIVKSDNGGQSFMSSTNPNIVRGDHYHRHKVERFMVAGGEGLIRIRKLFDNKIHEFPLTGRKPSFVDMPTFHTHSIENTGSGELTTIFWSNEIFDPDNPDTFPEKVVLGTAG